MPDLPEQHAQKSLHAALSSGRSVNCWRCVDESAANMQRLGDNIYSISRACCGLVDLEISQCGVGRDLRGLRALDSHSNCCGIWGKYFAISCSRIEIQGQQLALLVEGSHFGKAM